ncbi:hypothetical protein DL95DRAFT_457183 [Leptodontidium sp. 2 PMI_412]|nr:hypothetical protein DL95DRAFT_457183 [Leptodontidium sp. 2 PMI_412]
MAFWNLLQCFLMGGPLARDTKGDGHVGISGGVSVKSLVIDIRTPDVPKELIAPERTNPKKLAAFLAGELEPLWDMSYHSALYGAIVYKRVGSIKITLDGHPFREYDLAERLANVQFNNSFGQHLRKDRLEVFEAWKEKACKMREEFGLRTIPPVESKGSKEVALPVEYYVSLRISLQFCRVHKTITS